MILFGILGSYLSLTFGKICHKNGKISTKIHEIGKIKAIFGLGMTPIQGIKNGQIKSLALNSSVVWVLATEEDNLFQMRNSLGGGGGGEKSSVHHCLSRIYNTEHYMMTSFLLVFEL